MYVCSNELSIYNITPMFVDEFNQSKCDTPVTQHDQDIILVCLMNVLYEPDTVLSAVWFKLTIIELYPPNILTIPVQLNIPVGSSSEAPC